MSQTPVYIEEGGTKRMIGMISGRKFFKRVFGSKHLFKKLDAWGIDAEKFKEISEQVDEVRVLDEETNVVYSATPERISQFGRYLHFKEHGAQIFLSRDYWNKEMKHA